MNRDIFQLALVVNDYDEAIAYYTDVLGFDLLEDTAQSETKRWVRVAPRGSRCALLLAKAATEEQKTRIGNQAGGRVFLFMHTDDIDRDYQQMRVKGVEFIGQPREEDYGKVVVFADLYGNKWDLIQPASP